MDDRSRRCCSKVVDFKRQWCFSTLINENRAGWTVLIYPELRRAATKINENRASSFRLE